MNKEFKSNVEQVTEYMEFGSALNQAFVMEALDRYAKQVVEAKDKVIESMKNSFISGEAWVQSAENWLKQRGLT
jgi:hypothetical protein